LNANAGQSISFREAGKTWKNICHLRYGCAGWEGMPVALKGRVRA